MNPDTSPEAIIARLKELSNIVGAKDETQHLFDILGNNPEAREHAVKNMKNMYQMLQFRQNAQKYADDVYESDIKMGKPKHVAEAARKERLEHINNFMSPKLKP